MTALLPRWFAHCLTAACLALWLAAVAGPAQAQQVELALLRAERVDGAASLSFAVRPQLSAAVEDALRRGVPVYFEAEARVLRPRWYWRDERIATATRTWRLSYQPLTGRWRVGLGALSQSHDTLAEALAAISSATRWRVAEADDLEAGQSYEIIFSWRLDASQLPRPMQLDPGGQAGWQMGIERTLRLD